MKYWTATTGGSFLRATTTAVETSSPTTTADPNSLGELMRNAILLEGEAFPYDPKMILKGMPGDGQETEE